MTTDLPDDQVPDDSVILTQILVVSDLPRSVSWYRGRSRCQVPFGIRWNLGCLRVRQGAYEILVGRGAEFLTPPYKRDFETRCFFRDPDGHLFEISQV